jgi:hypothetical protein
MLCADVCFVAMLIDGSVSVTGNGQTIINATDTTSTSSGTDFGELSLRLVQSNGINVIKSFTISNDRTDDIAIEISSITLHLHPSTATPLDFFTISSQASPKLLGGNGGTSSFSITGSPTLVGIEMAQVIIYSNDTTIPVFVFTISITGIHGTSTFIV